MDKIRAIKPGISIPQGECRNSRLSVYDDPGVFSLVHLLPNPPLLTSDNDFRVALRNDSLEYCSRIKLFYGYYRKTWHHIPLE